MSVRQSVVVVDSREGQVWVGTDDPLVRGETSFWSYSIPRLLAVAQESRLPREVMFCCSSS